MGCADLRRNISDRSFNSQLNNRASKDVVFARIGALIQSQRLNLQGVKAFDPSVSPQEFSRLRSGEVERFGRDRLEKIEASILAGLSQAVAA